MNFIEAMKLCDAGLAEWKAKPHNARWWRMIDGTPIPNDLLVNIAQQFAASLASHRQPESDLGEARNARSVEAERVVERLTRIHNEVFPRIGPGPNYEHDDYFDELTRGIGRDVLDAIELLRAYAKLLRGERE